MARYLAIALVVTGLTGGRAYADRCAAPGEQFDVLRGGVSRGRTCGSMIVTTDASDTRIYLGGAFRHHSLARLAWSEPVRAPFEATFEAQLLTPGKWVLEVDALGVVVLLGRDRLGFFVDDAQMVGTMLADLPGVGGPGRRTIVVRRTAEEIVVVVNGKEVGRKSVAAAGPGHLVVGLRGAPGHRSRAELRSVTVRPLAAGP